MSSISEMLRGVNLSIASIPSIRITDIVDILCVAVVIYIVVCWIKETRAWSLFRGLLIIGLFSLLSYNLHFYTMTWIIEKTFSVGVIAFIVLFQPELRKALEQIGEGGFGSLAGILQVDDKGKITEKTVEEIITAAVKMSSARTGALIVIENNVPVGDIVRSGINIDAIISSQLLINIFENKTPLHDGAVIIRDNKIAAATCILPVTQSQIGLDLGTRHRAAVGASEVSDAYILVVSEETGAISIATEGRLRRNLTETQARAKLMELVETKGSARRKLWGGRHSDEKDN